MHFKSILCAWWFQNLTIKTTVHKKRIFTNTNYQNPKLNLSYLVLWSMPKPKVIFSDKSKENFYVWDKNWIWFCRYAQMQKCVDFIKEDKIFFKFFMDSLTVECCDYRWKNIIWSKQRYNKLWYGTSFKLAPMKIVKLSFLMMCEQDAACCSVSKTVLGLGSIPSKFASAANIRAYFCPFKSLPG